MPQFQAYVIGYSNHLADLSELTVQAGYYSAYYQSKHPKTPDKLIAELRSKREASATPHAVCVDVEAFERQEQAFKDAQSQLTPNQ